jgi:hypothetical protein
MRRSRGKICALLSAIAVGTAGQVWAGINFDPTTSNVTMTHDRDISTPDSLYIVKLGTAADALMTVPKASTINPPTAPQLNNNFGSLDPAHSSSTAVAALGQVTNNTTASFTLGTGSGVSQNDPDHIYPGASSLLYNVDLWWTVPAASQFGPLANGFASIAMGGTVGAGSSASLSINLKFLDGAGVPWRSDWLVNQSFGPGTIAQTFTTAKVLGGGTLTANKKLHITGTVEFRAANDGGPVNINPVRMEVGGTPPTGVFKTNTTGFWNNPGNWEQPTDPADTNILSAPSGIGYRALFYGTTGGSGASVQMNVPVTLGTLDVDNTDDFNFFSSGGFSLQTLAGSGNAVINIRGTKGSSTIASPIVTEEFRRCDHRGHIAHDERRAQRRRRHHQARTRPDDRDQGEHL